MRDIPRKSKILEWIVTNPTQSSKRDIAKAFGIKGEARIGLKRVLKELKEDGLLEKQKKTYKDPEQLPPVAVLQIAQPGPDGDLFARPIEWDGEGSEPRIAVVMRRSDPALGPGDRILARLTQLSGEDVHYEARLIRRISYVPSRILGLYRETPDGGRIVAIDKKLNKEWYVPKSRAHGAKEGELVEAEKYGTRRHLGLPRASVTERLGDPSKARSASLIAIAQHGIPDSFPDPVNAQAAKAQPIELSDRRVDLRDFPLITIDPADARDHDDACCAFPDKDAQNPGGHILWVAIADVAAYVTPGSPLDHEARKRGNSTYFPDRVVPMLPDKLSGDLCSLHEGVERACIALKITLDAQGNKLRHKFMRAIMRSPAALHYEEVQAAIDGAPGDKTAPLLEDVLKPLYAAYGALVRAREIRQPLELDLPERRVSLGADGKVASVNFKERLDAHRLIEEFMVLANVCAAQTLMAKHTPLLFRVHEEPSPEKLDALRATAKASGLLLAKGQVLQTAHLNRLLTQAAEKDEAELINLATLRSMTQAYYSPEALGHFGLALAHYAHFTSPIRRYADLIVHRALISAHGWGADGLTPEDTERLERTAEHISDTERRSMLAERDTTDRYLAAFLSERKGAEFTARVNSITRFGIFVRLDETAADGLIPMRRLGHEYFDYNRKTGTLMGVDTGAVISMGQKVLVKLIEAAPITGGLVFELLEVDGKELPRPAKRSRSSPSRRKQVKARKKTAGVKQKVTRKRKKT
jgi:ribonuclease R